MRPYILLFAALLFAAPLLHAGGPWPQEKNGGYLKLSEWWIVADRHFTSGGETDPNVTGGYYATVLYGEYGITDRWTAIVNAPLFARATVNNLLSGTTNEVIEAGDAINSVGDIEIGIKYGLITDKRVVVAASLFLGLPTGQDVGGRQMNLQTGDGEFNQYLRLDAGTSLGKSYVSAYAGFNQRTNNFSDEWRAGLEAGTTFCDQKIGLTGRLDVVESLQNGALNSEAGAGTSIFANNTEFVAVSAEARYAIRKNLGVSAGVGGALRGSLIYAAPSYTVGVYYSW